VIQFYKFVKCDITTFISGKYKFLSAITKHQDGYKVAEKAFQKYMQVLRWGLFLPHIILRQRMKKTIKYGSRTGRKLFEKDGSGKAFIYVQYWKTSTVRSKNSLHTQREAHF
jgi:hypothetical protein